MQYSTNNGSISYYDSILGDYIICDPTILFLLGIDSVLSEPITTLTCECDDCKKCAEINISTINNISCADKAVYNCENPECNCHKLTDYNYYINIPDTVPMYNEISRYIQSIGICTKEEHRIKLECNGLKLFFNNLTGTTTDKIIPILLKNEYDYCKLGLSNLSLDDKSQYIIDVYSNAEYDKKEYMLQYAEFTNTLTEDEFTAVKEYNKNLLGQHNKSRHFSLRYKYFDYMTMYSYALGVLFGCNAFSYDNEYILNTSPSEWYTGEYINLVKTAWNIFIFRFVHKIARIDNDPDLFNKYKGIQLNKLWNFNYPS